MVKKTRAAGMGSLEKKYGKVYYVDVPVAA